MNSYCLFYSPVVIPRNVNHILHVNVKPALTLVGLFLPELVAAEQVPSHHGEGAGEGGGARPSGPAG